MVGLLEFSAKILIDSGKFGRRNGTNLMLYERWKVDTPYEEFGMVVGGKHDLRESIIALHGYLTSPLDYFILHEKEDIGPFDLIVFQLLKLLTDILFLSLSSI